MVERQAFVTAIDMGLPMKVLKRHFDLTKEEVQGNIRIMSYHRLYLNSTAEISTVRRDEGLSAVEKIRKINKIRAEIRAEWKAVNE